VRSEAISELKEISNFEMVASQKPPRNDWCDLAIRTKGKGNLYTLKKYLDAAYTWIEIRKE